MTVVLRVCAEPGCPTLVAAGRCHVHAATTSRNHRGISPSRRGHGADYRRVRAALLGQPCHWCGAPATTADYARPQSEGGTLADLVPACATCNYARGARLVADRVGGSESLGDARRAVPQPGLFSLRTPAGTD